jgi:hypothetical protein
MRATKKDCWILAMVLVASAPLATAGTVISNMPGDNGLGNAFSEHQAIAQGFTMTGTYTFEDAVIPFAFTQSGLTVSLYGDSGGHPGTLIQTLTNPTFTSGGTPNVYTFTTSATITLQQGDTYWLVAENTSGLSVQWDADSGNSLNGIIPTGTGATFAGSQFANPISNGFSLFHAGDVVFHPSFTIDDTAADVSGTPEPGGWILAGAGLVSVMAMKRRRGCRIVS